QAGHRGGGKEGVERRVALRVGQQQAGQHRPDRAADRQRRRHQHRHVAALVRGGGHAHLVGHPEIPQADRQGAPRAKAPETASPKGSAAGRAIASNKPIVSGFARPNLSPITAAAIPAAPLAASAIMKAVDAAWSLTPKVGAIWVTKAHSAERPANDTNSPAR